MVAHRGQRRKSTEVSVHVNQAQQLSNLLVVFWGGSGHGELAKPARQRALRKSPGIKDQSCPMLQLSHKAMW